MKIDQTGKTAIVSGASAGIGWGCARALAGAGATVVLVARRADALAEACDRVRSAVPGANVRSVAADLGSAEGCGQTLAAEPHCDILVNNLGVYQPKPFFEALDEDWDHLFQINVMTGVRLSRGYLPAMLDKGWGRVVFTSSVDGIATPVDSLHYGVTKAGVLALSRGLAKLAGRSGVTVNAVLPGVTKAEWVKEMLESSAAKAGQDPVEFGHAAVMQRYPTSIGQRPLEVEEVANLVTYLCSPQASATTGSALRADGGIIEAIC